MNATLTFKCCVCGKRTFEPVDVDTYSDIFTAQFDDPMCPTCLDAEVKKLMAEGNTCDHAEWMWEEGEKYCLECGKNLTSGINWHELYKLERQYEEERDRPGDPEDWEILDGEFIDGELDPIEHVLYMKDSYPLLPDSKDIVL